MKNIFLILLIAVFGNLTSAQEATTQENSNVLTMVEQMPEFPGGINAMYQFIAKNINYPNYEKENGIEGKVIAKFIVNETGKISDIEIVKGASENFDSEVKRMIALMPDWSPGRQNGKPVKVYFTLPVKFALDNGKKSKNKTTDKQ